MMRVTRLYVLVGLMLFTFAACGTREEPAPAPAPEVPKEPVAPPETVGVSAVTIDVGKAVGPDKKVSTPSETFSKNDTIYASVDTSGTGSATLQAKWTYEKGDQVTIVNEESQTITPSGPATTEFHISKPDGWPAGDYQVEVFLDGRSVGMKKFKVS